MVWRIEYAVVAVVVALIVGLTLWVVHDDGRWREWCHSQGGHVTDKTSTSTVVTVNGKPGVAFSSTSFCLTDDGRILGIR